MAARAPASTHLATRLLLVACTSLPLPLGAQGVLTLQEALREARMANAMLPVARFDTVIARARIVEARGVLWPRLSAESDLHAGTPNRYTGNDARLQVVADEDLYDGGGLRAGIKVAEAQARGTRARYRLAEKDLDFAVELRYSELLKTEEELTFRRAGIARLRTYLASVQARQAAGQGVADDVLKTQVRLSAATADLEDAARRLDLARFELNDLLGRAPDGPVELAPLPPPGPPPADSTGEPWATAPDVRSAEADVDAALSNVTVARAGRRPHLSFSADAGALPIFPGSEVGTGLNNGQGWGMEFTFSLSWPVWDAGVYRARLDQARGGAERARQVATAVRREARLEWRRALAELGSRYREVQIRSGNVPIAQDSYLRAESLYRGGAATALDVLDAFTQWLDASEAAAEATLGYREAAARLLRWGTP